MLTKENILAIVNELDIIANESNANKRKVGAFITDISILLDGNFSLSATGFNKSMLGSGVDCENKNNETYSHVVHAEESAIFEYMNSETKFQNPVLFCTYSPCMNCCRLIIQAGISTVIFVNEHPTNFRCNESGINGDIAPFELLDFNHIEVFKINPETFTIEQLKPPVKPVDTLIVYHSADADGWLSGKLLKDRQINLAPNKEFDIVGWNYEVDAEWLNDTQYTYYVFGDICPPLDWIKKHAQTKNIIIYDHHLDAMNKISEYKLLLKNHNLRDGINIIYPENKYTSASKSIYNNLICSSFYSKGIQELVNLISDYDTWYFETPDYPNKWKERVLDFSTVIKCCGCLEEFEEIFDSINKDVDILECYIDSGKSMNIQICQQNHSNICRSKLKYFSDEATHVFVVLIQGYPNYFMMDQAFDYHVDMSSYDESDNNVGMILCCYNIDLQKDKVNFAFRSRDCGTINAQSFAKYLGGNGHPNAAGAKVTLQKGMPIIYDFDNYFEEIMNSLQK